MAVSKNLYTRGMSQKLGGAVFYQSNGQTLVRELAASVRNPRTTAQMIQRARLANLVSFYRANVDWMKRGAFENKTERQSDYNKFVSVNASALPIYFTKGMVAGGASVVDAYTVSQGSFPGITTMLSADGANIVSNLYLDPTVITGTVAVATTTVAELSQALLNVNNILKQGDQLSLIVNYQRMSSASIPFVVAQAFELLINTDDTRTLAEIGFPESFVSVMQGSNKALAFAVNNDQLGVAFVLSRTISGRTMVSTQELVLSQQQRQVVSAYRTESALNAYLNSYGQGENNFLDSTSAGTSSGSVAASPALLTMVNGNQGGSRAFNISQNAQVTLTFNKTAPNPAEAGTAVSISTASGEPLNITKSDITASGNTWVIAGSAITRTLVNVTGVYVTYADGNSWSVSFVYTSQGGGGIDE